MANTYTLIASSTVGAGGAASIDFTSIPSTYTDLCLMLSTRVTRTGTNWSGLVIKLNSTSYASARFLYGTGSAASSSTADYYNGGASNTSASTASVFSNNTIYLPNYAGNSNKTISTDSVTEQNGTAALATMAASVINLTSAITSISLSDENANTILQFSTAYLFGIKSS
jgi:hypothetical protein